HRHDGRLAVARQPLDADLLRVHRLVGLEVIEGTAGAPGPGPQRAPVVRLAGLALVAQADDAAGQAGAVVGLDTVGHDDRIPPAFGEHLLLPARPAARWPRRSGRGRRLAGR